MSAEKNSWGFGLVTKNRRTGTRVVMDRTVMDTELRYEDYTLTIPTADPKTHQYLAACVTHRAYQTAATQASVDLLRRDPDTFCAECATLVAQGRKYVAPQLTTEETLARSEALLAEYAIVPLEEQRAALAADDTTEELPATDEPLTEDTEDTEESKIEARKRRDRERKAAQRAARKALAVTIG